MANATQLWKTVGITTHEKPGTKIRYGVDFVANSKRANKGASRCDYLELPSEMTKVEALEYMQSQPLFQNPADQALIADELAARLKDSTKGEKRVKVAKPSLEAIKARAKNKAETSVADVLNVVTE